MSEIKKIIQDEKLIIKEIRSLDNSLKKEKDIDDKKILELQINKLKETLKKKNNELINLLQKTSIKNPLKIPSKNIHKNNKKVKRNNEKNNIKLIAIEKSSLKRLQKKEKKKVVKKKKSGNKYVGFANKMFSDQSEKLLKLEFFDKLKYELLKANLPFLSKNYISTILLTTLISFFVGIFIFIFFMIFNLGPEIPFITMVNEGLISRLSKIFWIPIIIPIITFFSMYIYPSLEKSSAGHKIDRELPFAAISMSAISGSMLDPSDIFEIMISTNDYPYLEKEFIKILNELNILGYDLINALKRAAMNSPSKKLAELLNGMSTTINSGGDLPDFFEKRAQTLLFEYRLEREKSTRSAETFMDIYISVVIAAPMILMLLLMMMKISGLGLDLSISAITLIMILGVTVINFAFLVFLHLKGEA